MARFSVLLRCPRGLHWANALARVRQAWGVWFGIGLGLAFLQACRGETDSGLFGSTQQPPPAASSVELVPAVATELAFGLRLVQPEFTYGALRGLSPRPLPQSLQVMLPALLGMNPAVSGRLVAGQDWLGVVTTETGGHSGWAFGVPVLSGRELVAELSRGSDARLQAKPRTGWIELSGLSGGLLGPTSLGVAGNYLLFGSTPTAVATLAPWLAGRGAIGALAPEQSETGLTARLFASGLALQALHAHLRERAMQLELPLLPALDVAGTDPLSELMQLFNDRLSAYLGALRGGDVHLRWQGPTLSLMADLAASELPSPTKDQRLCREIASLPPGVKAWLAGSDAGDAASRRLTAGDWDSAPGAWQATLLHGLCTAGAAFAQRVDCNLQAPFVDAPWIVAWRQQAGASTLLGLLSGAPPSALHPKPPSVTPVTSGRLRATAKDGKVLEWAWAPRGAGTMTALGAELGAQWDNWVKHPAATGWPEGLSPSSCEGLLVAAGSGPGALVSVSRVDSGLRVLGSVELASLGKWLQ